VSAAGNGPLGGRQTLYSIATEWHSLCRGQKDATSLLSRDPQHSSPYSLRPGRSGDRIPVEAKFSAHDHTGSEVHRASYTVVTGSVSRVMRPGCGVDQPPYLAPRLKKEYSYISTPTLGLRDLFYVELYLTMLQATVSRSKLSILNFLLYIIILFCMPQQPLKGLSSPHCRGFAITLRRTTVVRTPLDGWSVRRRDLYLTTHNKQPKPGGIRTRNPSTRAPLDPRLRPRGHWNKQPFLLYKINKLNIKTWNNNYYSDQ